MPYDDPDATDPMTLHGVVIETDGDGAMREMAECFAEEFIRSGFDADRILKMFRTEGYAGPFLAYQTLGEDAIKRIIDEVLRRWGGRERKAPSVPDTDGRISLPVWES